MRTQIYDYLVVGGRVRKTRELLSLTQEYVSNKIGVSPQHVSDIERGEVGISIGTLIKLCDTLNVTADYILFGEEVAHNNNIVDYLIKQLDDKDQLLITEFVRKYVARLQQIPRK
jgi:transcriptional regulator with XRE-family HTH domain